MYMNYGMVYIFVYPTNIHDTRFNLFFGLEYRIDRDLHHRFMIIKSPSSVNGTDYIGLLIEATVREGDVSK